jgi:hypothetical protein
MNHPDVREEVGSVNELHGVTFAARRLGYLPQAQLQSQAPGRRNFAPLRRASILSGDQASKRVLPDCAFLG